MSLVAEWCKLPSGGRMRRSIVLGLLLGAGVWSITMAAQQPTPAPLPELTRVKENFFIIESASPVDRSTFTGGNTGVFIMEKGVAIVDTKLAGYGPTILERIRK